MKANKTTITSDKSGIVIYRAKDGTANIEVKLEHETIWLTQKQIADLFGINTQAITKHINNIYASGELDRLNI